MAKFTKGKSGNPAGRPKTEAALIRKELLKHQAEVVTVLLEKMREGDGMALKMIMDRIIPTLKPMMPAIQLELKADSLAGKAEQILTATAQGDISPDQGATMIQALANIGKIIETTELTERIEKLEALGVSHGH